MNQFNRNTISNLNKLPKFRESASNLRQPQPSNPRFNASNGYIPFRSRPEPQVMEPRSLEPRNEISLSDRSSSVSKASFTAKNIVKKEKENNLTSMCSAAEIELRSKNVNFFEADPELSQYDSQTKRWFFVPKPAYFVKAFKRSEAGKNQMEDKDNRTPEVAP